jgi:hypothetical protein
LEIASRALFFGGTLSIALFDFFLFFFVVVAAIVAATVFFFFFFFEEEEEAEVGLDLVDRGVPGFVLRRFFVIVGASVSAVLFASESVSLDT